MTIQTSADARRSAGDGPGDDAARARRPERALAGVGGKAALVLLFPSGLDAEAAAAAASQRPAGAAGRRNDRQAGRSAPAGPSTTARRRSRSRRDPRRARARDRGAARDLRSAAAAATAEALGAVGCRRSSDGRALPRHALRRSGRGGRRRLRGGRAERPARRRRRRRRPNPRRSSAHAAHARRGRRRRDRRRARRPASATLTAAAAVARRRSRRAARGGFLFELDGRPAVGRLPRAARLRRRRARQRGVPGARRYPPPRPTRAERRRRGCGTCSGAARRAGSSAPPTSPPTPRRVHPADPGRHRRRLRPRGPQRACAPRWSHPGRRCLRLRRPQARRRRFARASRSRDQLAGFGARSAAARRHVQPRRDLPATAERRGTATMPSWSQPSPEPAGPPGEDRPLGPDGDEELRLMRRRFVEALRRAEIISLLSRRRRARRISGGCFAEELCEVYDAEIGLVAEVAERRPRRAASGSSGSPTARRRRRSCARRSSPTPRLRREQSASAARTCSGWAGAQSLFCCRATAPAVARS